jgi:ABC-2 type transport system ATP-binding protein
MRRSWGWTGPTAGTALVGGRHYTDLSEPLRQIGALLDAGAMRPGRTGRSHLRIGARTNGLSLTRVDEARA